jgi:hypothetical protein
MQQEPLFYEDLTDAIRATVQALGGVKKVGYDLWPSLGPDGAGARLRDCLNSERREKLSPDELLHVARNARAAGIHTLMAYLCGESGYSAPIPVDPEDQKAELQRQFIEMSKRMEQIARQLQVPAAGQVRR